MKKKYIFIFIITFLGIYFMIPYFFRVDIPKIPNSYIIKDIHQKEIGEIVYDKKYRHREISLPEVPEFFLQSIIKIEDRRFYYHSGIDYIGIIRALKNNIFSESIQGASTIDNQVIRNTYWLNKKRGYHLKIKEFILALALNKQYSKTEILEMYVNNINFGYLNYGVASASRFYYKKEVGNLTKAEILGLITIIKNPNKYSPITNLENFNKRFKVLAKYLEKNNIISTQEKNKILEEKLIFSSGEKNILPYVVDFYQNQISKNNISSPTNIIHSTIDIDLTQKIDELAKSSLKTLSWKNVSDYSVIIIEKESLNLKVMIGGNDYYAPNGQVNGTLAIRQPGSTLKPFLYAMFFEKYNKTPASTILDFPVSYPTADGNIYEPKNYSLTYAGEVSLAEALSQSINIPAVKILHEIGVENFLKFLKNIGIYSLNRDADFYGLSLALGSGEISLYELTRAYTIFTRDGKFCDINFINTPIPSPFLLQEKGNKSNCKKITDKKYTDMVTEILTNRYFKLAGFPIHSHLDFADREVFVKTGTSRNFKDNWTIGFTGKYIIGVWVGNKDGSEMKGVSGATGAGDVFRKIVYELDNIPTSSDIISLEKTYQPYIHIISPLHNSVYNIHPSVPIKNQDIKLNFSTNINYDRSIWYLNGEKIEKDFINIQELKKENTLQVQLLLKNTEVGKKEITLKKEE